eukprot:1157411-Pelagomonas_calceolata.AAC.2
MRPRPTVVGVKAPCQAYTTSEGLGPGQPLPGKGAAFFVKIALAPRGSAHLLCACRASPRGPQQGTQQQNHQQQHTQHQQQQQQQPLQLKEMDPDDPWSALQVWGYARLGCFSESSPASTGELQPPPYAWCAVSCSLQCRSQLRCSMITCPTGFIVGDSQCTQHCLKLHTLMLLMKSSQNVSLVPLIVLLLQRYGSAAASCEEAQGTICCFANPWAYGFQRHCSLLSALMLGEYEFPALRWASGSVMEP